MISVNGTAVVTSRTRHQRPTAHLENLPKQLPRLRVGTPTDCRIEREEHVIAHVQPDIHGPRDLKAAQ